MASSTANTTNDTATADSKQGSGDQPIQLEATTSDRGDVAQPSETEKTGPVAEDTTSEPNREDEDDDDEEFIPRGKPYRPVAANPKPIKR